MLPATKKTKAMVVMENAPQKAGIWTEHVDAASGRTYYFNLVQNRSYWTLPQELLAQVRKPVINTLREWDPEAAARYEQPTPADDLEQQRKKREEVLQAAALVAAEGNASASSGWEERMAMAAAQKRSEEIRRMASEQKAKDSEADGGTQDNAYLSMVRELQAKDRDTEATGSKWLVR